MPDHHQSPFLFEAQPGYLSERPTPRPWQRRAADVCFILVKASAFLGAIYLGVLGLPLVFFLLLTGGEMTLLFTQLGNLAGHYLAADPVAQALFANEMKLGLLGIATLVVLWRLPVFLDQMAGALAHEEQVQ